MKDYKNTASQKRKSINQEISANVVRLIGEKGEQLGVMVLSKALGKASDAGLDLVEMSEDSNPPVCRLVSNYEGACYQKLKEKKKQKTAHKTGIKEIKFRPGTEEADYEVKRKRAVTQLSQGYKIKASLRFRGREIVHQRIGLELLERFAQDLGEYAVIEQHPKLEGRQMIMLLASKRKKD